MNALAWSNWCRQDWTERIRQLQESYGAAGIRDPATKRGRQACAQTAKPRAGR